MSPLKPLNGCSWLNVQSLPGVTLHCEHACELQPAHAGEMGWLLTAVNTPTGVVRALSCQESVDSESGADNALYHTRQPCRIYETYSPQRSYEVSLGSKM